MSEKDLEEMGITSEKREKLREASRKVEEEGGRTFWKVETLCACLLLLFALSLVPLLTGRVGVCSVCAERRSKPNINSYENHYEVRRERDIERRLSESGRRETPREVLLGVEGVELVKKLMNKSQLSCSL